MARHAKATGPKSLSCLDTRPRWRVNLPLERSTLSTLAQARLHQSRRSIHRPRATRRNWAAAKGKVTEISDRVHVSAPPATTYRRCGKGKRETIKKNNLSQRRKSSPLGATCCVRRTRSVLIIVESSRRYTSADHREDQAPIYVSPLCAAVRRI